MLFKVKNLGVIAEAEVDLSKDLILLTGQNNTGKTYLAYAIYWLQLMEKSYFDEAFIELLGIDYNRHLQKELKKIDENIIHIAKELYTNKRITIDIRFFFETFLEKHLQSIFEFIKNKYLVENSFNTFFNSNLFSNLKINISLYKDFLLKKSYENSLNYGSLFLETMDIGKLLPPLNVYKAPNTFQVHLETSNNLNDEDIESLANHVCSILLSNLIFDKIFPKSYIFTAERSAINIFSKELTLLGNKILRSKDKNLINFATERINRYPQPIKDSLDIAENLKDLTKKTSNFAYLAEELEKSILKGNIVVGEFDDLQYKPDGVTTNLEIHLTSSLVKSLSPIAFYLRHLAQKNDCIIIDEPELNLHPDNQILVARFLGRLVNEGFKVIVSTHSNFIIREINNLIMLNKSDEKTNELKAKYGYLPETQNETLKPEQVGAYLFRLNQPFSVIPVTETGFNVATIDETTQRLNECSQDIYFSLFD